MVAQTDRHGNSINYIGIGIGIGIAVISLLEKTQPRLSLSKNKLFNDILDILKSSAVGWSKDDVNDRGSPLVDKITDCLWYLDGHHHTLAAEGFPVYNPEMSHSPEMSQLSRNVTILSRNVATILSRNVTTF